MENKKIFVILGALAVSGAAYYFLIFKKPTKTIPIFKMVSPLPQQMITPTIKKYKKA